MREHVKRAMREVDDPQDAEDQGHPHGYANEQSREADRIRN